MVALLRARCHKDISVKDNAFKAGLKVLHKMIMKDGQGMGQSMLMALVIRVKGIQTSTNKAFEHQDSPVTLMSLI